MPAEANSEPTDLEIGTMNSARSGVDFFETGSVTPGLNSILSAEYESPEV